MVSRPGFVVVTTAWQQRRSSNARADGRGGVVRSGAFCYGQRSIRPLNIPLPASSTVQSRAVMFCVIDAGQIESDLADADWSLWSETEARVLRGETYRCRMTVAYDGTEFRGWQYQINTRNSVQATLEKVFSRRLNGFTRVVGASRTDTGVHARGQVAHFDIPEEIPKEDLQQDDSSGLSRLEFQVNRMLPANLQVLRMEVAPPPSLVKLPSGERLKPWHSIYCAQHKIYSYKIMFATCMDPLERLYRHHEYQACDTDLFEAALQRFVGTHDFSSFANRLSHGEVVRNPVRTVHSVRVIRDERDPRLMTVEVDLQGALYKMVRNMIGAALHVARHDMPPEHIDVLLGARDRRIAPKAAPARGLCLDRIFYADY
ncbi:tRNA pseudouridine synthase A 1 [Porphyridium purpureum]|uniref:tRNA pseudouridine synthase n=1 Tax=Porphyridium purpureum TaxID=35688 RepID=A0A5J4YW71_PORPP|nr:tRNA pseudouridine synthase A 1 [Porphyridium purpureum]|eukprot:POR3481..scf227_4